MAYVLLNKNGVVVQKQGKAREGFIEADDHVFCGMIYKDGLFIEPEKKGMSYQDKRKTVEPHYNNGDAIDAMMKQFNIMRMAGDNLCDDLDAALNHWLSVKVAHPKGGQE